MEKVKQLNDNYVEVFASTMVNLENRWMTISTEKIAAIDKETVRRYNPDKKSAESLKKVVTIWLVGSIQVAIECESEEDVLEVYEVLKQTVINSVGI
jgi:hypothetical protein